MIALITSVIALTNFQQSAISSVRVDNRTSFPLMAGWSAVSPSSLSEFKKRPSVDNYFSGHPTVIGSPPGPAYPIDPYSATYGAVSVDNGKTTFVVVVAVVNKQRVAQAIPVKFKKDGSLADIVITSKVSKKRTEILLTYQ